MADTADRAAGAFERLLQIEAQRLEQAQRAEQVARRQQDAERLLAEGRERESQATLRVANAQREMLRASQEASSSIHSAGRVMSDIFGGRFISAFQGMVQAMQASVANSAARATRAAQALVTAGGGGGGGGSTGGPGGGGGGVGGLATLAAAAGPAGMALAAVAGAAGAAYGTLVKFAGAAAPGTVTALNQSFDYLKATIGQALVPHMVMLGASVIFTADLLRDTLGTSTQKSANASSLFKETIIILTKVCLGGVNAMENFVRGVAWAFMKLVEVVSNVLAWAFKKVGMKKTAERFEEGAEKVNVTAPKAWTMPMLTDRLGGAIADKASSSSVGGKGIDERWQDAVKKFSASSIMAGQRSGFESSESAYKRIQEFSAGLSPVEQEKLDLQRKQVELLGRLAETSGSIERKTGPTVVK